MKAVGIVAEYNPFHLGHQYHIEETRQLCPERAVVAVQSGDFVQRGEAAIFDKHTRARAAVLGGADLVLELPLPWSIASAEPFARGAVGLLGALGVTDCLSFGSECGSAAALETVAVCLDSEQYRAGLRRFLNEGMPFAACRQAAVGELMGTKAGALLASPNNILGIEYIRAIRCLGLEMKLLTVLRSGAGHDAHTEERLRSASAIRGMIYGDTSWREYVPRPVGEVLSTAVPADQKLLGCAQLARLQTMTAAEISRVPDCTEGLENRIFSALQTSSDLSSVLEQVKTRRYAMSRLRRMLLCAALGVCRGMDRGVPPYARVLAANRKGLELLGEMKKTASVPVITKPAHGLKLEGEAGEFFRLTAAARAFYALGVPGLAPDSDLRTGPFICLT